MFLGETETFGPDSSYKYLTTDQMDSLADDSIQPDVTDDEKHQKAAANIKEVSNEFIRCFHQFVSRIFLSWKREQISYCPKQFFFASVCQFKKKL